MNEGKEGTKRRNEWKKKRYLEGNNKKRKTDEIKNE